jgi:hypothetical protein
VKRPATLQVKVLRLYFGLVCKRTHTAVEMAEELGVSAQVIGGILRAGQRRLATEGLTAHDLREAARCAGEASASGSPMEPRLRLISGTHRHHRSRVR